MGSKTTIVLQGVHRGSVNSVERNGPSIVLIFEGRN
jgi:hypothetical protein